LGRYPSQVCQVRLTIGRIDEPDIELPVMTRWRAVPDAGIQAVGVTRIGVPVTRAFRNVTCRTCGCAAGRVPIATTGSTASSVQTALRSRLRQTIRPSAALPTRTGSPIGLSSAASWRSTSIASASTCDSSCCRRSSRVSSATAAIIVDQSIPAGAGDRGVLQTASAAASPLGTSPRVSRPPRLADVRVRCPPGTRSKNDQPCLPIFASAYCRSLSLGRACRRSWPARGVPAAFRQHVRLTADLYRPQPPTSGAEHVG
jgi:hypothetical protein